MSGPRIDPVLARQVVRYGFLVPRPLFKTSPAQAFFAYVVTRRCEFRDAAKSPEQERQALAIIDSFHRVMETPGEVAAVVRLAHNMQ